MNPQPSQTASPASRASRGPESRTSPLPSWWLPGLYAVLFLWLGALGWLRVSGMIEQTASPSAVAEPASSPARTGNLATTFRTAPASLPDAAYQQAALAYEAERKAQLARPEENVALPGSEAARQHWQAQQAEMRRVVDAAPSFPEGSLQWHLREELRRREADAPEAR